MHCNSALGRTQKIEEGSLLPAVLLTRVFDRSQPRTSLPRVSFLQPHLPMNAVSLRCIAIPLLFLLAKSRQGVDFSTVVCQERRSIVETYFKLWYCPDYTRGQQNTAYAANFSISDTLKHASSSREVMSH